jgi:DNA invertase Pin-like site-specific DNA recombinase
MAAAPGTAQANRLTIHILAAVAGHEVRMISERTEAALPAAKARGVRVGGDHGGRPRQRSAMSAYTSDKPAERPRQPILLPSLPNYGRSALRRCEELRRLSTAADGEGRWRFGATRVSRVLARLP